ncbi:8264_t:CDS:2, partial [Scutellospora calospora]
FSKFKIFLYHQMDSEDITKPSTSDTTDNQQEYFTEGSASATCVSCRQSWLRGKPKVMESHLALRCEKVSDYVSRGNLHFCVDNIVKEAL